MKKILLAGLAVAWMAAIPISGFAAQMPQTIDAPHLNIDSDANTEDCAKCHFAGDAYTCGSCHTHEGGGYVDTTAPKAQTHFGMKCTVCHNPHVSLQYVDATTTADALVHGTITNINASQDPVNATEFTVTVNGGIEGWDTAISDWSQKTTTLNTPNIDRGLIFWTSDGTDNYSFEVTSAVQDGSNVTVTVQGDLPEKAIANSTSLTSFQLHYGQLIARAVSASVASYRDANATTDAVIFPALGNTGAMAGNHFVTPVGDGICQKCHTATPYWTNNGLNADHNAGSACTSCHTHKNDVGPAFAFGLGGDCGTCHPNYPEPPSSGAHTIHAGSGAGQYNFECRVCHKGGMEIWSYSDKKDDLVQLGFNLIPNGTINFSGANTSYDGLASGTFPDAPFGDGTTYGSAGYDGQNDTSITNNGTMTCSNIYCHSDGYASGYTDHSNSSTSGARCTTSTASSRTTNVKFPNVTPPWDGSWSADDPQQDGNKCNNCHDVSSSFSSTANGYTEHSKHVISLGNKCNYCHFATTTSNDVNVITSTAFHANGNVDIKANSGALSATGQTAMIAWDATTHTCTNSGFNAGSCHNGPRAWRNLNRNTTYSGGIVPNPADDVACEVVAATANVDPVAQASCANITANTFALYSSTYDEDYINPVKEAAYGGHNTSSPAFEKLNWNGYTGSLFEVTPFIDAPQDYSTSKYSFAPGSLTNNEAYLRYIAIDNSGPSVDNEKAKNPGGWQSLGWILCDYGATDPNTNEQPIQAWTASTVNASTIQIVDHSVDFDWNDSSKNTANGCGNDGGQALIRFKWYDAIPTTNSWVTLTDTPIDTTVTHTYDPAYIFPGQEVWWSYQIRDNTEVGCGTNGWIKSGWQMHNLL